MLAFLLFYSTISWWKCPTFMLALMVIFFRRVILIGAGKLSKILCYLILVLFRNNFIKISNTYVIIDMPYIKFWFLYNKIDPVYDITWWEIVWANCGISRPERDIIYKYRGLKYISQLFIMMNQTSCVGNVRSFYFNDEFEEYIFVIIS